MQQINPDDRATLTILVENAMEVDGYSEAAARRTLATMAELDGEELTRFVRSILFPREVF